MFHRNKFIRMIKPTLLSLCAVALLTAVLLWWGMQWLDMPPIYRLARAHSFLLRYQGHIIIASAVLLAWFRQRAALSLDWLAGKLHRWLSALILLSALWMDAAMHIFSIPHIEGWWLPLCGGSAFISGLAAFFPRLRKKSDTSALSSP